MSNVGCVIIKDFQRPDRELVDLFKDVPIAFVDDAMNGTASLPSSIHPVNHAKLLGPAFTVRCPAGDNLMFHKAMDMAQPGDIIVIDGDGFTERALVGELMSTYCMLRGVAGIVVNGAIRDEEPLSKMDFPVYSISTTPNGPYQNGPGEINTTISIGGVIIRPGDIIMGDDDGVLVVKPENARELCEKAKAVEAHENEVFRRMREDGTWKRQFVDDRLQEINCQFI